MEFCDDGGADDEDDDEITDEEERMFFKKQTKMARDRGIHVVSAFEGYAFDYGMRVGDKLEAIDDMKITEAVLEGYGK